MKNSTMIYALICILIIVGATMQIMHVKYGNTLFIASLVLGGIYQLWVWIGKKRVSSN